MFTDELRALLSEPLDPARVKAMPPGTPAAGAPYLAGEDVIENLNRIFGYGGWSLMCEPPVMVEQDEKSQTWMAHATILIDGGLGARYDGIGIAVRHGTGPAGLEMAIKGAATDAMKRAAVHMGDQFGLVLREKGLTPQDLKADYAEFHGQAAVPRAENRTVDTETGEVVRTEPPPDAYTTAPARDMALWLKEMGWSWQSDQVVRVLGQAPGSKREASTIVAAWLGAVPGRTVAILQKQIEEQHSRSAVLS